MLKQKRLRVKEKKQKVVDILGKTWKSIRQPLSEITYG